MVSILTDILTDHLVGWFLLFVVGITVSSACGVNPFVMSNKACEHAVAGSSIKKAISYASLIAAIIGEYAFFFGVVIVGVRYFVSRY